LLLRKLLRVGAPERCWNERCHPGQSIGDKVKVGAGNNECIRWGKREYRRGRYEIESHTFILWFVNKAGNSFAIIKNTEKLKI